MKTLIISQPKSGTYLLANILENMGLMSTWMHINAGSYDQYDPTRLAEGRKNPEKFRTPASLEESVARINDYEFAMMHLAFSKKTAETLYDFKKIILSRDPKEAAESWNRWNQESGRGKPQKVSIPASVKNWIGRHNTFDLTFDDMINKNVQKIDDLQTWLYKEIRFDSLEVIERALASDSLTKSTLR